MKQIYTSIIWIVLFVWPVFTGIQNLHAQNLILNGGFENFTACPNFASQLGLATPWFNPNAGTPEYFNSCADYNSWVSIPAQPSGGYQEPHGGEGYAGIFIYRFDVQNMREYLQVPLQSALEAGECYYFEMFVNLANDHRFACDRIGAFASVGALNSLGVTYIDVNPHIENLQGVVISDTARWTRINGYFTANGGEDHITIGNFRSDEESTTVDVNPNAWYTTSSYVLIDDVSLVKASFQAELNNQTHCNLDELLLDVDEADATYLWQDGSTNSSYVVSESGNYEVTISRGSCQRVLNASISMLVTPNPILVDSTICEGHNLKLEVNNFNGDYIWSTGATDRTVYLDEPGIYWVEVSNVCGVSRDSMELSTFDCGCEVFLPSAFTPNRDAINDDFYIAVDCPKMVDFRILIYNRGGELIYETNDPYRRWDGTYSGRDCPSGVYTYSLSYYTFNEGQLLQEDYSGSIRLVR